MSGLCPRPVAVLAAGCAISFFAPRLAAAPVASRVIQATPVPQTVPPKGAARADTDAVAVPRLKTLVITASRVGIPLSENPAAIKVVGREVLDAAPRGIAVDEAVVLVPGVKVDNQANGKRVHLSMRGQGILSEHGIRGINVLLDGLPLNDPTGFAADFYDVDWPTVDRVLVQRGPAASLYGGGSSAGVISVLTADGGSDPYAFDLSGSYGSNNFKRLTGQVGGTLGGVNYRTSYTRNAGDGYRVHTAFHGDNFFAKAHWNPTAAVRLTPVLWYTSFYNQNAEGLNLAWLAADRRQANPDALTYNEYMDTRRGMGGVSGTADLGGDRSLAFNGFVRRTAYRESVPSQVLHRTITAPGGTLQFTIERPTGSLRHTISVGTDAQWQTNDGMSHPNLGAGNEGASILSDQLFTQWGVGVFALDRIDLGNHWGAMLNVRYDRVDNKLSDHLKANGVDLSGDAQFDRATGRVGLTWSPRTTLNFYGNIGQGVLPPATEELDANPAQIGGFNTSLRPAVSLGGELGVRGALGGTLVYDLGGFLLNTDHDFDRYRVSTRPLETFYRNAASSRRAGVESYMNWMPVAGFALQAAYTWSKFTYTNSQSAYGDVRDHQLPNSPIHQLSVDAQYTFRNVVTLGAGTQALSKWYVDPSNTKSVAGYALLNARLAWKLHLSGTEADLMLSARNILGKKYIAFTEPDPDGNSYQPAAEREIFLGLRVRQ
jgi:iron complex outermembrane receptor protein